MEKCQIIGEHGKTGMTIFISDKGDFKVLSDKVGHFLTIKVSIQQEGIKTTQLIRISQCKKTKLNGKMNNSTICRDFNTHLLAINIFFKVKPYKMKIILSTPLK